MPFGRRVVRLAKQVADLTEDNRKLQQQIDELLKQI